MIYLENCGGIEQSMHDIKSMYRAKQIRLCVKQNVFSGTRETITMDIANPLKYIVQKIIEMIRDRVAYQTLDIGFISGMKSFHDKLIQNHVHTFIDRKSRQWSQSKHSIFSRSYDTGY